MINNIAARAPVTAGGAPLGPGGPTRENAIRFLDNPGTSCSCRERSKHTKKQETTAPKQEDQQDTSRSEIAAVKENFASRPNRSYFLFCPVLALFSFFFLFLSLSFRRARLPPTAAAVTGVYRCCRCGCGHICCSSCCCSCCCRSCFCYRTRAHR